MLPTAKRVLAQRATGLMARAHAYSLGAQRQRLQSTLAILEQKDGVLNHSSLSAFTAAKKLGGPVHGFIAGNNIKPVAEEIAKSEGVEKIIAVDNSAYEKVGGKVHEPNYTRATLTLHQGSPRELCSPLG